tara:strand:+ start:74 stop:286 length:213 start_codon:yes stop_codon:yes gene_type:complete
MAIVSKTFIQDADANTNAVSGSLAKAVEDYITGLAADPGLAGSAGAREIEVSCTALSGDRVFVIVTAETS